jgi:hypothetical protein
MTPAWPWAERDRESQLGIGGGVQMTAQELLAAWKTRRPMIRAPESFSGDLHELATSYVVPNLISPEEIADFHPKLVRYLDGRDPMFLIRAVSATTRGQIYRTKSGGRFKATDNAPAWWIHFALFQQIGLRAENFSEIIESVPTHFFEVAAQVPESISAAGWHVAHIFAVKDRDTDYRSWSNREMVRRCVRNIHPCNYFFVPKTDWQTWGGNERVIAYFAGLYQEFYGSVWTDFLSLSRADPSGLLKISGPVSYRIAAKEATAPTLHRVEQTDADSPRAGDESIAVAYTASRLSFKADLIEPLAPHGRFRIVTPSGTFEMSKAEFYSAFPNVVKSRSYKEGRLYHYPTLPSAVLRFRVASED